DPKRWLVHVYDMAYARERSMGFFKPVEAIAFSSNADLVAVACPDGATIWHLKGSQKLDDLPGTPGVTSIAFSSKDEILALATPHHQPPPLARPWVSRSLLIPVHFRATHAA